MKLKLLHSSLKIRSSARMFFMMIVFACLALNLQAQQEVRWEGDKFSAKPSYIELLRIKGSSLNGKGQQAKYVTLLVVEQGKEKSDKERLQQVEKGLAEKNEELRALEEELDDLKNDSSNAKKIKTLEEELKALKESSSTRENELQIVKNQLEDLHAENMDSLEFVTKLFILSEGLKRIDTIADDSKKATEFLVFVAIDTAQNDLIKQAIDRIKELDVSEDDDQRHIDLAAIWSEKTISDDKTLRKVLLRVSLKESSDEEESGQGDFTTRTIQYRSGWIQRASSEDDISTDSEASESDKETMKRIVFDSVGWVNSGDQQEFVLNLTKRLDFATTYAFEFTFYYPSTTDVQIDSIFTALYKELYDLLTTKGDLSDKLRDEIIQSKVDLIKQEFDNKKNYSYEEGEGLKEKAVDVTIIDDFADKLKNNLFNLVAENGKKKNAEKLITTLNGILLTTVNKGIDADVAANEIQELVRRINDPKLDLDEALEFIDKGSFSDSNKEILRTDLKLLSDGYKKVSEAETKMEEIRDVILKDKKATVQSLTTETQSNKIEAMKRVEDVDVVGEKIGTAFGVGLVFFEIDNDDGLIADVFQSFGLKFYFQPFDKRLEDPYAFKRGEGTKFSLRRAWSKSSLLVGIVTSPRLVYEGQELIATNIGVKPLVGLNYDVTKQFSVGIGALFFNQPTPSTLSERSTLVARPYINLNFDFNVINYLIQKNQ